VAGARGRGRGPQPGRATDDCEDAAAASTESDPEAPSATSAAPAPAGNKAAAASGGGQQAGAQSAPKNAQKGGTGRIEHVPAPGKSSSASGNSTNRNPRQGKGRR